jgi:hypothetical protein
MKFISIKSVSIENEQDMVVVASLPMADVTRSKGREHQSGSPCAGTLVEKGPLIPVCNGL